MIDAANGYIQLPDGLVLRPMMAAQYIPRNSRSDAYPVGIPGSRISRLGLHEVDGRKWSVGAIFARTLDQVLVQLQLDTIVDWSLDSEKLRNRHHIEYMREAFRAFRLKPEPGEGVRVDLPWGSVACSIDLRGLQALLLVTYHDQ